MEFVFISPMGLTFFSSSRLGVDLAGCDMVFVRSGISQSLAIEATFIGRIRVMGTNGRPRR